jgi:hypothetical protein
MIGLRRAPYSLVLLLLSVYCAVSVSASLVAPSEVSSKADSLPLTAGISSIQPGTSTTLLDKIGRFFSNLLPSDDGSEVEGDGGLFGDGSTIAWGGSTLEVVVRLWPYTECGYY